MTKPINQDPNFFTKSSDWVSNINYMHRHYGVHQATESFDSEKLRALLDFRVRFIEEEFTELVKASDAGDSEEVVDALIDLCVVAIGTLDIFGVNVFLRLVRVRPTMVKVNYFRLCAN
jgi:predicted HAD superfamily Cof-like phosphohydrolase